MELHLSYSIATVCFIFLIFLFQLLTPKGAKNKNPPQAKGAWPIIGHLHYLGGSALPHRILSNMADIYGPIFTIKLGVRQVLVVSGAEMAKECFTTNDKFLASRPKSLVSEIMGYNYGMFALSPYGEYFRQVRKMVTVELLSQRRVEMLKDIRVSEVRTFMKDINDACVRNKTNTVKVEMREFFANLVLNIITRTIAGKRFSPGEEEAVAIHAVVRKFFEFLGTFVISDFIPYLKFLDLGGHVKGMKLAAKEMDDIIDEWLQERKKRRESGEQHYVGKQDFLDTLLSIVEGASKDEFPGHDHETIIRSTSLAMISAGFDSTAVTLTWAIVLLLNNPKTLKLAQEELDLHVGRERLVDEPDIKNLVYLQAIIKETLRLYPPAPISLIHESADDCIVGGYMVPKGTLFFTNLWKLHRDPNAWSDPYEFQPERFLTDQKGIDLRGQHYDFLPFGSGRRMCPGLAFALPSLHLTLASLIQGFDLASSSNEPVDTTEIFRLTNNKATPLEVLLSPRLFGNIYSDTA